VTADHWRVVALGVAAFVLALLLVPVARRAALARGITDNPTSRKHHRVPTPYLGGVAIVAAVALASLPAPRWEPQGAMLLLGAFGVAAVGLVDDVRTVSPASRVVIEAAAAVLAFAAGARVHLINDPADLALTVAWLVVVTNAFNLLDNIDGAAGAVASTIAAALTVACLLEGQWLVGTLAAVTAGACLGYLVYNWHPASIFMGDAGSLFLGFMVGVIALRLRTDVEPFASVVAVVLLVAAALFDTTLVVLSRVWSRRSILVGGTDHTSHRLVRMGLAPSTVTLAMAAAAALTAGLGVAVSRDALPAVPVAVGVGAAAAIGLGALLRVPGDERDADAAPTTTPERPRPNRPPGLEAAPGS
jgi:UDP-GlcNAc:undecaprenyl-phosphate GlcNAc-1-phosphate transferase